MLTLARRWGIWAKAKKKVANKGAIVLGALALALGGIIYIKTRVKEIKMPIFGYEIQGGSQHDGGASGQFLFGSKFPLTETGKLISITAWFNSYLAASEYQCAIYDSSLDLIEVTEKVAKGPPNNEWTTMEMTMNLLSNPVVAAGDYWLMWKPCQLERSYVWKDPGDVNQGRFKMSSYADFPASIAAITLNDNKYSIYCTYERVAAALENKSGGIAAKMVGAGLI